MDTVKIQKPHLTSWQIWNMSFGFFGIQVGLALQNANMSRVFQTLGANVDDIPILWAAAPITGFFVQPIIGYLSDRTWNKIGRRRPYFLMGAIFASLALLVVPNASALWIAAGLLWILDASINVSMEPFRALVADMLPEVQRTSGFAFQSFFIGTGSVLASSLPSILKWFGIRNTTIGSEIIPPNLSISFYLGAFIFISAVIWTVIKTREYPPEEFKKYYEDSQASHGIIGGAREIWDDIRGMPKTMRQLGLVQFFTWFGLFTLWIYASPSIAKNVFGAINTTSQAFNDSGDWVGNCFAMYNGVAAIIAFLLPYFAKKTSRKTVHIVCLILGGLGLISIFFIKDQYLLLLSMVGIGVAWASILSMPYAILSGALPPMKMGIYMGIFNFFIVIPQIMAAAVLGFFVKKFFHNEAVYALLVGGIFMFLAALCTFIVDDKDGKTDNYDI